MREGFCPFKGGGLLMPVLALCLVLPAWAVDGQDQARQRAFERIFGEAVRLDPLLVAKVKGMSSGQRLRVDRDGDGRNDETWFIDSATRHTENVRPLLVRVIDEDGDLDTSGGPDLDSDLYIADWHADGTVDAVVDYRDDDGDGDVDAMGLFYFAPRGGVFGDNCVRVWWARDVADDNLLWYDVNYTYDQRLCQYRSHFSGNKFFVAFGLTADAEAWLPGFENPFLFYDEDGDHCAEVALRISGVADKVRSIRYSFDADDDAFGRRSYDYDFSVTAVADEGRPLTIPSAFMTKGTTIRGIPTGGWLRADRAREWVEQARWDRTLLTWDEMNANTEADVQRDPHERWEGVIAHGSEDFPQVGAPPCSKLNKRNEVSFRPAVPMRLYWDPCDRKLHLRGASKGWLYVDYDFDGKVDAEYRYEDRDGDGVLDRRLIDVDADGHVEFDWPMAMEGVRDVPLAWRALSGFYKAQLEQVLADSQAFIDAVKACFAAHTGDVPAEPTEAFFLTRLEGWMPEAGLGRHIRKTPAGARFYMDLVRDRMLARLHSAAGVGKVPPEVDEAYRRGDYREAARILTEKMTNSATSAVGRAPLSFMARFYKHRVALRIDNTGGPKRVNWPVSIPLERIEARTGPLQADRVAVVTGSRWLDWREVPHQVDTIDPDVGAELSFLADVEADARATYYLCYDEVQPHEPHFARRTATARDWVPPNIGWESNRCAYREYFGQFDFFGKKVDRLIYDTIGRRSYHEETDWGIDALHVGQTPGLGGLTVYVDGKPYPVQNPGGQGDVEFDKRMLTAGAVRAAVEVRARHIVPDRPELSVRLVCLIYDEHQETEVRARIVGDAGEAVLAPALVKLTRERFFALPERGCFGSWGWQEDVIGEIGLGMIVDPQTVRQVVELPDQRRVLCAVPAGRLRYWLIGDWRRGRQFPVAPTVDNWREELVELADRLVHDVSVEIGTPEETR